VTSGRRLSALSATMLSCRTLLIAVFTLMTSSQLALAQQTLGAINGTVTDSSGAVVSNVNIKARSTATNLEVSATSKSDGNFSLSDLPIGNYEVTFTKEGFQTQAYPRITVQGSRTSTVKRQAETGRRLIDGHGQRNTDAE
jgi:hypothetical protein